MPVLTGTHWLVMIYSLKNNPSFPCEQRPKKHDGFHSQWSVKYKL